MLKTNRSYDLILLAAGEGTRSGAEVNKIFVLLKGKPLIAHTLGVFQKDPNCARVILVVRPEEKEQAEQLVEDMQLPASFITLAFGGETRQESVQNGLKKLKDRDTGWILVHDGARPFITKAAIDRLLDRMNGDRAATLAVPSTDTIKWVEKGQAKRTLDRSFIWRTQTPQSFEKKLLMQAIKKANNEGFLGNEEGELVERLGIPLLIAEGDTDNIKITVPTDWFFADAILKKRLNEQ